MSLSSALDTAKSSLAATQAQTSIISRNIANVNTVGATKKYANVITGSLGQVQVTSITQSSNAVLYSNMLEASSAVGKGNVIANGLTRISETLGDTKLSRSPAAMISKLNDALSTLAASPNNYELARNAASAATDLVTAITSASATVQSVRRDADAELVNAAADMNKILSTIEDLNNRIIAGTRSGADVTDLNDARDQAVVALSQYVGVTTLTRGNNDLVIYTDSGVTLFEATPRTVSFQSTGGLNATVTEGNAFMIDGTAVTGGNAYMPIKSGSVAGLVALRDDIMVTYQTQLDEMARGLIDSFNETSGAGPVATGLFTATGISSPATASVGVFKAGTTSTTVPDTLTFNFVYGDTTYAAQLAFTDVNMATDGAYADALKDAIETAKPVGGGTALGEGKVTLTNNSGAYTLSSDTSGALGVSIFNVKNSLNSKTGGLKVSTSLDVTPGAGAGTSATAASVSAGTFVAGTLTPGDKIKLDFSYNGTAYTTSVAFTSSANFQSNLNAALEAAVPVAGGSALGTGKISATIDSASLITLTTAGTGNGFSLGVTGVAATAGDPSAHNGGLTGGASANSITGLAAQLKLADGVTADPTKIRDGVNYDYNSGNAGSYTTRLNQLADAMGTTRAFSATSGADPSASLADYAASSISWLQATRQTALSDTDYKQTVLDQTQTTLSNETGINMDEQLTRMLELERSFQAASKLISTIDDMLKTLLNSI